ARAETCFTEGELKASPAMLRLAESSTFWQVRGVERGRTLPRPVTQFPSGPIYLPTGGHPNATGPNQPETRSRHYARARHPAARPRGAADSSEQPVLSGGPRRQGRANRYGKGS